MYETQNFLEGDILTHEQLNHMEKGIIAATPARNLLDNSNFAEPVNQRGNTTYTSAAYTIDRWYLNNSGTLKIVSGGIKLTGGSSENGSLVQRLASLTDGTYTFAANVEGAIKTLIFKVEGTTVTYVDSSNKSYEGGYLAAGYSTGYKTYNFQIRADTGYTKTFKWVALYEGAYTADTLPPYVPKGFAVEYAECQRYFISPVGRFTPIVLTATTTARMTITTTAPMRKVPTATLLNGDNIILNNGSGKVLSVTSVAVDSMEGNRVYLSLTCSEGPQYAAGSTFVTSISLSADT